MTIEEQRTQSVEAHKGIINRFIDADDKQLEAETEKKRKEQAAPYQEELDQILARKHQNGFFTEKDKERAPQLVQILESIEKGEFEATNEGMQAEMSNSVKRILDRRKEQQEAQRREREGAW